MRAKHLLVLALLASLLGLTSCVIDTGDWHGFTKFTKDVHFSYPLRSGGRLSVETFNGSVEISSWDQETVDISGTKYGPSQDEADNLKVNIDNTADSVSIRVDRPSLRRNNQGARFVIKVPRKTIFSRITTSNGSIRTTDGQGPARFRSSNGSIYVSDFAGTLDAETSNSGVDLVGVDGDSTVRTSNGHIHADRLNGSLDASTSNGGVQANISRVDRSVHVETSNSGVELTLPAHFNSGVRVSTNNGGITIRMPDGANAHVLARTSNASVSTDFEVRASGELRKGQLDGVIGSGGPLIDLSTSNSSIRILRR